MRRPTRTRRLSIAAIVSLLAFVVLAGVGIRSFRVPGEVRIGWQNKIAVEAGYVTCVHIYQTKEVRDQSGNLKWPAKFLWIAAGFRVGQWIVFLNGDYTWAAYGIEFPLWFPLLLLLITPLRWLAARPVNGPAFPVITDATQA